jgi:hypothetical protein
MKPLQRVIIRERGESRDQDLMSLYDFSALMFPTSYGHFQRASIALNEVRTESQRGSHLIEKKCISTSLKQECDKSRVAIVACPM